MKIQDNKFDTGLTNAEQELLALLMEECGEVIQVIGKIMRHGYESYNPNIQNSPTNRQMLEAELGDVVAALSMLEYSDAIDPNQIQAHRKTKLKSVKKWLHFN